MAVLISITILISRIHFCPPPIGALTDALKQRIDKRSLPSQQVATSRLGIKNVSKNVHCSLAEHIWA